MFKRTRSRTSKRPYFFVDIGDLYARNSFCIPAYLSFCLFARERSHGPPLCLRRSDICSAYCCGFYEFKAEGDEKAALAVLQACHNFPGKILITPDNRYAVDSASLSPTLCVTDLKQGNIVKVIKAFPSGSTLEDFSLTSDGTKIVATSKNNVSIIDLKSGSTIRSFTVPHELGNSQLSADNTLLIAMGGWAAHTAAWNLETGKLAFTLLGPKGNPKKHLLGDIMLDEIRSAAISPDGRRIR